VKIEFYQGSSYPPKDLLFYIWYFFLLLCSPGGMNGPREGGKEGRREGGKEGRREGGKQGRREGAILLSYFLRFHCGCLPAMTCSFPLSQLDGKAKSAKYVKNFDPNTEITLNFM
jgi:hypothetical protein